MGIQEAQEAPKVFLEGPEAVLVPWAEEGETSGLEEAMWRSPGLSQMILEQLGVQLERALRGARSLVMLGGKVIFSDL